MCRSRRELSNEYLLAKFGFDTAENKPCKVCPLSAYRSPRLPGESLRPRAETEFCLATYSLAAFFVIFALTCCAICRCCYRSALVKKSGSGLYDFPDVMAEAARLQEKLLLGRKSPQKNRPRRTSLYLAPAAETNLEWVNWIVQELWPLASTALERLLRDDVAPDMEET